MSSNDSKGNNNNNSTDLAHSTVGKKPKVHGRDDRLHLYIRTGTTFGAGTDSKITARIYYVNDFISPFNSGNGSRRNNLYVTETVLDNRYHNDFEQGQVDIFKIDNIPPTATILAINIKNDPFGIDPDWFLEDIVAVFHEEKQFKRRVNGKDSQPFGEQLMFQEKDGDPLILQVGVQNGYSFFHLHQWVLVKEERTLFNQSIPLNEINYFDETRVLVNKELEIRQHECVWAFGAANIEENRGFLNQIRQRITRLAFEPADIDFYRGNVPNYPLYPPLSEDFDDPKFGWFLKVFVTPRIRSAFLIFTSAKKIFETLYKHYIKKSEKVHNDAEKANLLNKYNFMVTLRFDNVDHIANNDDDDADVTVNEDDNSQGENNENSEFNNRDDNDFGRQVIQGVTCNHIFRFSKANSKTKDLINEYIKIDDENTHFVLDYLEDLTGILLNQTDNKKWYCSPCVVLLKLDDHKILKPIAILLRPDQGPEVMITPNDPTWRVAKAFARCAMFNIHQMIYHAFRTHFASEVYFTALYRQLPTTHPLYILLYPHMRYVAGINDKARTTLVSAGGKFDDISAITGPNRGHLHLFHKELQRYNCFNISNAEEDLRARGFDITDDELPHYYFAKDSRKLFKIFFEYSKKVLEKAYKNTNINEDNYIKAFLKEVRYGFVNEEGLGRDGLPNSANELNISINDVATLVAQIIFMSSAQHAAVNFGQFMQYGNVENGPAHLRLPPPATANENVEDITRYLPDRDKQISQMTLAYTLSSRNLDRDRCLFQNPDPETRIFFNPLIQHHPDYIHICLETQKELEDLENEIIRRNNDLNTKGMLQFTYDWLLPSKVPISIAI